MNGSNSSPSGERGTVMFSEDAHVIREETDTYVPVYLGIHKSTIRVDCNDPGDKLRTEGTLGSEHVDELCFSTYNLSTSPP